MFVKYIEKEKHEIVDRITYVFYHNEVKEIPDTLGEYLTIKFPTRFKRIEKSEIKKDITGGIELIENDTDIYNLWFKGKKETKFKKLPIPSQDVKNKDKILMEVI